MDNNYKAKAVRTVVRLLELCRAAAANQAGVEVFKGLSVALTLLYEEHTGRYLHSNNVSPLDVMQWAETVKRTGEI